MSLSIQEDFDKLKIKAPVDPLFYGKKNAWFCDLSTTKRGEIAENLVARKLGGSREPNNKSGYNVVVDDKMIEVVSSRVYLKQNKYSYVCFHQIRPKDDFSHLCFVVIYPEDVRIFLVPRDEIPSNDLHRAHGKNLENEIYNIETRQTTALFPWMTRHEVF